MLPSAEERFRVLFERSSVGMAFVALDGTVLGVNEAACRLCGRSEQELVGSPGLEVVHPDDRRDAADRLRQLADGQLEEARLERRFVRPDGSVVWAESQTQVVRAPDGTPLYLQTILVDITARRQAEAAREWTAANCVVSMDYQGRVVEFNPAAERAFGYRRDQALGQFLAELIIPPPLRAAHAAGLARYLETGVGTVLGQRLELAAIRADGTEFPVELVITRVALPGPPVFTAYLRDITDRKPTEAERQATG